MKTNEQIQAALEARLPQMTAWRRYLHQHPEPSFHEQETARYIAEQLREMGCDIRTGVGGHGIVATIRGERPGPVIALRADIDALPIQDEKDVPYRSTVDGVMHACGHDAHTSTMLGIASYYQSVRGELQGERRLLFQPAEEICPGGAKPMIEAGVLEGVDAIYGVHLWSPLPYGAVATRPGPFMAAADEFTVTVTGQGGHGGLPHQTIDAVVAGSALVQALQSIVSRNVNPLQPAVLSVGAFHAGKSGNVIAERAVMNGTVRTFDPQTRRMIRARMEQIVAQTAELHGAKGELNYREGYPSVVNDAGEVDRFMRVAAQLPGELQVERSDMIMAAEDFAYYLQQVPGCFMFVGAGNEQTGAIYAHHHPRFDLDERAMAVAARLLIAMAEDRVGAASGTAGAG
ncbi:amidohydrolase [Paenibacillus sp. IB182496]|uniref:Amidohydrolase n=1 Tax=Paenibacillus sabuli TaxID=2772509 RepID=A0A927GS55_9BACL|nr:M20 family metallopeptidase [Paenibacillus sabuli]MBD2846198.1 amidohydrolase [Paenibacillus sabuli]